MLVLLGDDPAREGLRDTPRRWARAMLDVTKGIRQDPKVFTKVVFHEPYDSLQAMRGIPFYSLCEHHLFPFFGTVDIAYLPKDCVFGASKMARLVDCFSRRLQIQERMTEQIAKAIEQAGVNGVAVVVRARHFCMEMRGVQKQGMEFVTSAVYGAVRENPSLKDECMKLLRIGG
jgi:GTP cyclohydrolase I